MSINPEVRTRFIGGLLLFLMGAWVLHSFLPLLAWAVVLAISTWPVYRRLLAVTHELHGKMTWSAIVMTVVIAAIILAPLGYGLSRLTDDTQSLLQMLNNAQNVGIPPPEWLETLPVIGAWAKESWIHALGSPEAAKTSLHWLGTGGITYTKAFAGQLLQQMFAFLIILLVLPFVYQYGDSLARQILASSQKLFGDVGVRYASHATATVRATVNGMLLIGIAKALLMGIAYAVAGVTHPALIGALTGIFAMIPLAAKLIFGTCSLVLIAEGHIAEAAGLFTYGMIFTLIADNYVRPALIGNAVQLPFIWTLLGIFGGMEAFGLLGLFLGPTIMAVLMSIWRDWIRDLNNPAAL